MYTICIVAYSYCESIARICNVLRKKSIIIDQLFVQSDQNTIVVTIQTHHITTNIHALLEKIYEVQSITITSSVS